MATKAQLERAEEYIVEMLDGLPILAAQIGIRGEEHEAGASTPEEQELAEALHAVSATWRKVKPS